MESARRNLADPVNIDYQEGFAKRASYACPAAGRPAAQPLNSPLLGNGKRRVVQPACACPNESRLDANRMKSRSQYPGRYTVVCGHPPVDERSVIS